MQQTTNYHLNQWAPEDRILRTNFNSDNAKVDTAIKAVETAAAAAIAAVAASVEAAPYKKLLEVTTTAAAVQIDLDVSGIDFTQYQEVILYLDPAVGGTAYGSEYRCNNISSGYVWGSQTAGRIAIASVGSHFDRGGPIIAVHLFFPANCIAAFVRNAYFQQETSFYSDPTPQPGALPGLTAAALTSINILSNQKALLFAAGAKIRLYGVKK